MSQPILHRLFDGFFTTLLVLFCMGLLVSIKQWPEWFRRARSSHWPRINGMIESGSVSTVRSRSRYFERGIETATAQFGVLLPVGRYVLCRLPYRNL
jgi:hypothetical protein